MKKIEELQAKIAEKAARIAALREGKNSNGLAFLIESGMERAELVMAAKSITDKLQQMAESLAKIEASDVMPMMDSMKENFGLEVATKFEQTVSGKLREMTEALRDAKDHIGNEILRMEASVNGEPASDMQMDAMSGDDAEAAADADAKDVGDETAMSDADLSGNEGNGDQSPPQGEEQLPQDGDDDQTGGTDDPQATDELNNLFADNGASAVGRARKESVETKGMKALRESADPDALIVETFRKVIRSGRTTNETVEAISRFFSIDVQDVVQIILDTRK